MGDELLNAIIQLENRIQHQLQKEQARADRWLAGIRSEQQDRISRARQEFAAAERQALAQARRQGELEAADLHAREKEDCNRLEEISDEALWEVLRRQLVNVYPETPDGHWQVSDADRDVSGQKTDLLVGQVDDHQDGEN